jgi:hypothetical protein
VSVKITTYPHSGCEAVIVVIIILPQFKEISVDALRVLKRKYKYFTKEMDMNRLFNEFEINKNIC